MEKSSFILAKVSRPAATLIARETLVGAIAKSGAPLVWIAAPAGSGKTSLALAYARSAAGPTAWLRLDEVDTDPASFMHYFEQAVHAGCATMREWQKPQLLGEHLPTPQGYFRLFVRSLAACISPDACVVLDDAHKCQDVRFFRLFLDILAEEMPPSVRILILSRLAPPEGCARLLAHEDMLARFVDAEREYATLEDPELRSHLALGIYSGLSTTDPGHPDLALWETRSLAALNEPISPGMKVRLATWSAIHLFFSGQYRRISALRASFDGLVDLASVPTYQIYFLYQFDELARGDHAMLATTYDACQKSSENTGFRNMDGHYALQYADSRLLQGDLEGARAVLAKVLAALHAASRIEEAGRGFGSVPYEMWGRIGRSIAATLLELPEAAEQVEQLRARGEQASYPAALIHADLLDAWRLHQQGAGAAALPRLQAALSRWDEESEGFLWAAVPQILQPLCALALREDVMPQMARNVIRAFRLSPPANAPAAWPWPLTVRCFGSFELRVGGQPLPSRGKSKHRQLDLVKLVAAHAPAPLPLSRIAETLWPDSEGDAARHALDTTLSRLRGTLGREVFRLEHGAVSLDRDVCWLDTAFLDDALGRLEAALAAGRGDVLRATEEVLELYRGDLLSGETPAWLLPRRDFWRGRLTRAFGTAARNLAALGDLTAAAHLLDRALAADPCCEPLTAALMAVCLDAGRYAEGMAAYRRVALSNLGAPVAAEIESLAQRLHATAV